MVFVKNLKFFHVFIFGKISQQNVFDVILESKKRSKTIKNRKLKKSKNQDFSKGVLYFRQNRPGKCVWPLERKKAFLHSKITKLKKLKVWYFSKGVGTWFWSKTLTFLHLFFLNKNRPGKCVWRYSKKEKKVLTLKKIWNFSTFYAK